MSTNSISLTSKLIELLADGSFHSGDELGRKLGVTRAAVWRITKALPDWGIELLAVRGKGYKLARPLELLSRQAILNSVGPDAEKLISGLELHNVIESTNSELIKKRSRLDSGHVCAAEYQTGGKGRRGRIWRGAYGSSGLLSVYWRFSKGPSLLGGLSLAIGVAAVEALTRLGFTEIGIKWPNDIYWNGRKLGGILIELSGESEGPSHAIIGLGLNVVSTEISRYVEQPIASLEDIGIRMERNRIVGAVISELVNALAVYEKEGFSPIYEKWERFDVLKGRRVQIQLVERTVTGISEGIDEHGQLLVQTVDGRIAFNFGEVGLAREINGQKGI